MLATKGYQVHLVDPLALHVEQALAEARRVLRPGGVLAAIRRVEAEPSMLGASSHLLVIAHRPAVAEAVAPAGR